MADESPYAKAHQAIGAYFCAFSALEHELGESIKVIFRLQGHEASDAIVAALGDVAKKIDLVWTATLVAKKADGSETTQEWKDNADKTMKAIWQCNGDRVLLAHSHLEPDANGSVVLSRLRVKGGELKGKGEPNKWVQAEFENKIVRMNELTKQLKSVKSDLSTFQIALTLSGQSSMIIDDDKVFVVKARERE
jgi:hypothetical protein